MIKNPNIFLQHILESIASIEGYTKGMNQPNFNVDIKTQDAVMRRIEIIGEATKNLPVSFRKTYPTIPWRSIADMRNKLIHEYFGVDLPLVWTVVKSDLPKLKKQILEILKEYQEKLAL